MNMENVNLSNDMTFINALILINTYNIPVETANKVARNYNAEILSMPQNKQRYE